MAHIDGVMVVSVPASSAKSARGPEHASRARPDTDITGRHSLVVNVLAGTVRHYRHVTAVGTLFTINCLELLPDVLLKMLSGVYWPTAGKYSPCLV
jgi:hypothetical protein